MISFQLLVPEYFLRNCSEIDGTSGNFHLSVFYKKLPCVSALEMKIQSPQEQIGAVARMRI